MDTGGGGPSLELERGMGKLEEGQFSSAGGPESYRKGLKFRESEGDLQQRDAGAALDRGDQGILQMFGGPTAD